MSAEGAKGFRARTIAKPRPSSISAIRTISKRAREPGPIAVRTKVIDDGRAVEQRLLLVTVRCYILGGGDVRSDALDAETEQIGTLQFDEAVSPMRLAIGLKAYAIVGDNGRHHGDRRHSFNQSEAGLMRVSARTAHSSVRLRSRTVSRSTTAPPGERTRRRCAAASHTFGRRT